MPYTNAVDITEKYVIITKKFSNSNGMLKNSKLLQNYS